MIRFILIHISLTSSIFNCSSLRSGIRSPGTHLSYHADLYEPRQLDRITRCSLLAPEITYIAMVRERKQPQLNTHYPYNHQGVKIYARMYKSRKRDTCTTGPFLRLRNRSIRPSNLIRPTAARRSQRSNS